MVLGQRGGASFLKHRKSYIWHVLYSQGTKRKDTKGESDRIKIWRLQLNEGVPQDEAPGNLSRQKCRDLGHSEWRPYPPFIP